MNRTHVAAQSKGRILALTVLAILIVSSLLVALNGQRAFSAPVGATQEQTLPATKLSPDQLYTALLSSVVRVEGHGGDKIQRNLENAIPRGMERFLPGNLDMSRILSGNRMGAGFFIDDAGHIITSYSLIEGVETVHVTFSDGAWYVAEIVGSDQQSDFAVLRIPELDHDFTPLPFAHEGDLGIGDPVYALGFPESLTGTLTRGIVNNMETRRAGQGGYLLPYLIQSDTANPQGFAGSPLINEYGEAVGIHMDIPQPFGTQQAASLSLPIGFVKHITAALIQGTQHPYPLLGVAGNDLDPTQAAAMDLDNLFQGAYISAVGEDSAAANGGIQEGDFLTAINGNPINTFSSLAHQLLLYHAGGEEVQISVLRGDQSLELTVTLGTRDLSES